MRVGTAWLDRCERVARTGGLATALAEALVGVDVATTAPGRYAAVPAGAVPDGVAVTTAGLAALEGIVFAECGSDGDPRLGDPRLGDPRLGDTRLGDPRLDEVGGALAAARLGLTRRLLDLAVEHLSDRDAGGEPLIRKQLVTGTVADVIAEIELLRAQLHTQHDPAALADLHVRLDDLGWQVTTLFGAAGYVTDHPARALYVAALVAHTWVDHTWVDHTVDGASR